MLDVDEDALARARQRGVDHVVFVARSNPRQAAAAARIVEDIVALDHIRDAVLQLGEHVGAMVDTQAVTRTQVLIDPYPHDTADPTIDNRPGGESTRMDTVCACRSHSPSRSNTTGTARPAVWTTRGRGCAIGTTRTPSPTSRRRTRTQRPGSPSIMGSSRRSSARSNPASRKPT